MQPSSSLNNTSQTQAASKVKNSESKPISNTNDASSKTDSDVKRPAGPKRTLSKKNSVIGAALAGQGKTSGNVKGSQACHVM